MSIKQIFVILKIVLYILFIIFIGEGVGVSFIKGYVSPYFLLPVFFFAYLFVKKKSIYVPRWLTISFLVYLLVSLVSTFFFSIDKQISFEQNIFYLTGYLIFIIFYNNKDLKNQIIQYLIIGGSIIFTAFYLLSLNLKSVLPVVYRFILPADGMVHNRLGDFLGLILILFIYRLFEKNTKTSIYWLLIFLPFFLLSFSRSAIMALLVTLVVIIVVNKPSIKFFSLKILLITCIFIIGIIFFFGTVKEAKNKPIIGQLYSTLSKKYDLTSKDFSGDRINYLRQGFQGLSESPLFGIGAGNFAYISKKYSQNNLDSTNTAHSLLLEVLFDSGIFPFVFFFIFIFLIFWSIFKNRHLENYLLLYLLLDFQTDYTYRISALFILFMVLAAIVYEERESIRFNFGFNILTITTMLIYDLIIFSAIFLQTNQVNLAFITYPLNKEVYPALISKKITKGCETAIKYGSFYYYVSPKFLPTLELLSSLYSVCGHESMSLKMLGQALSDNKFLNFSDVKNAYGLIKQQDGKAAADKFFSPFYLRYKELFWQFPDLEKEVTSFCEQELIASCPRFKYFWQPQPYSKQHPNPQLPFSTATNIMNADGLNNTFNYPLKKEKNTFRIMVLGGAEAYGLYIPTDSNWVSKLENSLNNSFNCPSGPKKFEVINLSGSGDDISYAVQRFETKGIKYHPDLILFFLPDTNLINETLENIFNQPVVTKKDIQAGNFYPGWNEAWQKMLKQLGNDRIFDIQKTMLQELKDNYSGQIIFMSKSTFSDNDKQLISSVFSPNYFEANLNNSQGVFFPDGGNINANGQQIIASELLDYLNSYDRINLCSNP